MPSARVSTPATGAFEITPADGSFLEFTTRGLFIGAGGDLHVVMESGDEVTFPGVPAGFSPICVKKVFATSTTAEDIIGLR